MFEFQEWPKIARLFRDVVVTEKIDGTNAAIHFDAEGNWAAQSHNRLITVGDENFGFAKWVDSNAGPLFEALGEGLHFGEWCAWWFLSFQPTFTSGMLGRGKFRDRLDACTHAQDRENGVEVMAQGEVDLSHEAARSRVEANLEERVRSKYPESFRKSLAFYVGGLVEWKGDADRWTKDVLEVVDRVLLGIEYSETHDLVPR